MEAQARNTRQKQAIRMALLEAGRPLSPEEVLQRAQEQVESLSLATVYRNLATMAEDGSLTPVALPGEATRYEMAGKDHHHHFQCGNCRKVFELQGCSVLKRPKLPRGFRVTGHEFFLFGTCADCR